MRYYEIIYLISANISEGLKSLQEKINSFIKEGGGILEKIKEPVKIKLSHPIKKESIAFESILNFQLKPEGLPELEKKLKSEDQLLRYIILNKKPDEKKERVFDFYVDKIKTRKEAREPLLPPVQESRLATPLKKPLQKVELKEIDKKLEEILGE